ncbi:unnamed protein product, partial [Onchocerca ochengi]|uniref:Secreted protein n=1 Tax=Onchocerca ochengi TaxID=42157 RepID=A0A182EV40_ONCOC
PDSTEDSPEKSEEEEPIDNEDEGRREDENENAPRGPFVSSMGTPKQCDGHPDCYDQREPSDWCLLQPDERWTKRGCFCSSNGKCTIERHKGDGFQHTDCSPRNGWTCKYDE